MKKIYVLISLAIFPFLAYSQGTRVGDSNSPIYHNNGNVGVGVTVPQHGIYFLTNSKNVQELDFRTRITYLFNDHCNKY